MQRSAGSEVCWSDLKPQPHEMELTPQPDATRHTCGSACERRHMAFALRTLGALGASTSQAQAGEVFGLRQQPRQFPHVVQFVQPHHHIDDLRLPEPR